MQQAEAFMEVKMNLQKDDFLNIRKWMYRNARPLDIARWKYHFENGKVEDVLAVMEVYQNEDGGFGSAFEADSWNPNSTPYTTSIAVRLLDELGFCDKNHPIVCGILRYLENTTDFIEGYWPAVVPSNNYFPHRGGLLIMLKDWTNGGILLLHS